MAEERPIVILSHYNELDQNIALMQTIIQHTLEKQYDQAKNLINELYHWIISVLQRAFEIYNAQYCDLERQTYILSLSESPDPFYIKIYRVYEYILLLDKNAKEANVYNPIFEIYMLLTITMCNAYIMCNHVQQNRNLEISDNIIRHINKHVVDYTVHNQ